MSDYLQAVFAKTDGYCHLCHRKLCYSNYGKSAERGAWHIEHSKPKAKGGTNHLNNLFAACIGCNLRKGINSTRRVRMQNGVSRAPYSKAQKDRIHKENLVVGTVIGAAIGGIIGGPILAGIGSAIGREIGGSFRPKK